MNSMESVNFINYIYIADLAMMSLIEHLDYTDHSLVISDKNQIFLDLSKHQKDILSAYIIDHLLHAIQYGKKNVLYNTCKPKLNWRQSQHNNILNDYKYKLIDNSIYVDLIKFNQFLDNFFEKLKVLNLNNLKYNNIIKESSIKKFDLYKNILSFLSLENIDSHDLSILIKHVLENVANVSIIDSTCYIIQDGNTEYIRTSIQNEQLMDIIRQKLIEIKVL